jgi:anti-sigma-K factor RskA
MEHTEAHELSAAYALDSLDEHEARAFEEHLAGCDECRAIVASFRDVAAALAHAVPEAAPPSGLRERILERVRSDRPPTVVPLRPRWALRAAGAVAAVAAAAAIAVGIWAASLSSELESRAETYSLSGARGSLVVTPSGDAALIVIGLAPAPAGRTYEIWVIENGTPLPAGLFEGGASRTAVALTRRVPEGAAVAVTLERAGGVRAPTGRQVLSADTT